MCLGYGCFFFFCLFNSRSFFSYFNGLESRNRIQKEGFESCLMFLNSRYNELNALKKFDNCYFCTIQLLRQKKKSAHFYKITNVLVLNVLMPDDLI